MTEQFDQHKWIFEWDGALLDIYVNETTLDDWLTLIDFLNANYLIKFVTPSANQPEDRINKDYIREIFLNKTRGIERGTVSVYTGNLVINGHFFLEDEIKFDADPREFKGQAEFEAVINFMTAVSKAINKEIILSAEGVRYVPLITIYASKGILNFQAIRDKPLD